jgi:hypothetical protein
VIPGGVLGSLKSGAPLPGCDKVCADTHLACIRRQRGPYRLFWRAERDFLYDRLPAPIRLDSGVLAVALRQLREIQGAVRKSWLKL